MAELPVHGWRRLIARMVVIVLACLAGSSAQAQEPAAGGLYEVDVPVADQSPGARQQAARNALAVALTRLTGLATLPDDPRIRRAIGNPDGYYVQFGYAPGIAPGALQLRVQFSPQALFQLIRETGLPIWPSARPVVLAWLILDDGAGVRVPDGAAEDPVAVALLARARERGLVIRLAELPQAAPAMAADPLQPGAAAADPGIGAAGGATAAAPGPAEAPAGLDPEAVALRPAAEQDGLVQPMFGLWEAPLEDLQAASRPDTADLYLVARVQGTPDGAWAGSLEIHEPDAQALAEVDPAQPASGATGAAQSVAVPGVAFGAIEPLPVGPLIFRSAAPNAEALGRSLVDQLVDHLLVRYQVQAGDARVVRVAVRGVGRPRDYADVLRLFGGVEVVDDVVVEGAAGDRIRFALTTMAASEQLLSLVTADGRLIPDPEGASATGGAPPAGTAAGPALQPIEGAGAGAVAVPGTAIALELFWQGT